MPIFPAYTDIPVSVRADPLKKAELQVYDALSKALAAGLLPKGSRVYYSRPWMGLRADGSEIDGEADFVIASQDGVLVLEVKGGEISVVGDQWYTKPHGTNLQLGIKNPFDQAMRSVKHFQKMFRDFMGLDPQQNVRIRRGVVLPAVQGAGLGALGSQVHEDIVATFEMIRQPQTFAMWVEQRLGEDLQAGGKGPQEAPITSQALERFHRRMYPVTSTKVALGSLAADAAQRFLILEQAQSILIQTVVDPSVPNWRVIGGAGTGKSLLALHVAILLSLLGGLRVVLLCKSRLLAGRLASDSRLNGAPTNLEIVAFADHRLGVGAHPHAFIVDEGQDFTLDEAAAIADELQHPGGRLLVFGDDNQNLQSSSMRVWNNWVPDQVLPLRSNLRNSKEIFALAQPLFLGGATGMGPQTGIPPEWRSIADAAIGVQQVIGAWCNPAGIARRDVVVLAINDLVRDRIGSMPGMTREIPSSTTDKISVATILDYKGLEGKAVILALGDAIGLTREQLYVGITRATTMLAIVVHPNAKALIESRIGTNP